METVSIEDARKILGFKNKRSVYEYIQKGLLERVDAGITLESCYKARETQKESNKLGGKYNE